MVVGVVVGVVVDCWVGIDDDEVTEIERSLIVVGLERAIVVDTELASSLEVDVVEESAVCVALALAALALAALALEALATLAALALALDWAARMEL